LVLRTQWKLGTDVKTWRPFSRPSGLMQLGICAPTLRRWAIFGLSLRDEGDVSDEADEAPLDYLGLTRTSWGLMLKRYPDSVLINA